MNLSTISSPGVYINEVNTFPNSVPSVATAVPAFIGYTPTAAYEGKNYTNVAVRITSFADFKAFFCFPDPAPPAAPAKQYNPQYYLVQQNSMPTTDAFIVINNRYYSLLPDPSTIYYLYNSIRLFYENGGGNAYVVSVGSYGPLSGKPMDLGAPLLNPNVKLNDLTAGLKMLLNEQEPTMYICPEATLLSVADNGTLMQQMLLQCAQMQTAMSIFDVNGGRNPDPVNYTNDITVFRNNTGTNGLDYGAAYYPFIGTTIVQYLTYTNLFGGDVTQLLPLLSPSNQPDTVIAAIIQNILKPSGPPLTEAQNQTALINASQTYQQISNLLLSTANLLPPSGAIAGVITTTDNQTGPWEAPANTSIAGVVSLPIKLNDTQQSALNIDPVSGKSINAIRSLQNRGILVWGACTLDGNSPDWCYINVRRTITFIEQSCKLSLQAYTFAPNAQSTWQAVTATLSNFLTSVWKEGGLQGASPSDAFSVTCGIGTTMTADDLLNGMMKVSIKVCIVRPAEFIVISLQQQMAVAN